jgi:aspartate/methionine/tyrosine aminotransferase
MLDRAGLGGLIAACQDRGRTFISDEIYHGLHYGDRAVSALEISDDVCVINSFSKYFSMTGWRIGWMVVPEAQVRVAERLAQNMFICAPHVAQIAALGALGGDAAPELEANRDVYAANRALVIDGLRAAGLAAFAPPDGAFYVYVDTTALSDDSRALAADILDRARVAVTPGLDFDPVRGHGTLRLSYARATADIAEGMARLGTYFAAAGQKPRLSGS